MVNINGLFFSKKHLLLVFGNKKQYSTQIETCVSEFGQIVKVKKDNQNCGYSLV